MSVVYILVVFLVITAQMMGYEALQIIEQPLNVISTKGSFAWLKCGVIGEAPINITWYHNGNVVKMLNSNRVEISDDGKLIFLGILASHIGTYYCIANNTLHSVVSRNAIVRLAVLKWRFRMIPTGGYYERNETVVLSCKPPYGQPKPLVRWYKNGEKIRPKGKRLIIDSYETLTINSFEAEDEGYYHCEAHSIAGIRRSPETVVALVVPLSFVQKPVDVTTRLGSLATFYCFAEGSPEPTISWQKENILLSAGQTSGRMRVLQDATLEVFDVQIMDKGKYTCIVENNRNKILTSDVMLNVLYAPVIVSSNNETAYENNRINLRCEVDGFPVPTVSWFTEDDVQPRDIKVTKHDNEHFLTIKNVKDVHEGKYVCEAKNNLGVARKNLFLDVGSLSCSSTQFMCGKDIKLHCIPKNWVCDLDNDCGDNIDEENCVDIRSCSSLYDFSCTNGRCIPWHMTCDGDNDCRDGSDEHQDLCFHKCHSASFFTCRNWKCIPKMWRCDGYDDCKDNSDEVGCAGSSFSCKSDEFQCVKAKENDKKCIPKTWRCDKEKDCSDSSDENNCDYTGCGPGSSTFPCHNGDCIPLPWKCDGQSDCRDGSDERACKKHDVQTTSTKCNKGDHLCDGVWCIHSSWVCDGDRDCRDGSDERNCGLPPISTSRCRQDQYECDEMCIFGNQVCDGNYDCPDRSDETMCQEYILYSKQDSINKLNLHNLPSKVLISSLQNAVALDIDLTEGRIYWTDISQDNIQRAMLNGPNNRTVETIIQFNLESPEGLAIDWIGRKLYWTDLVPGKIEVSELDGKNRAVLISKNISRPRAIVVHPEKRNLFWTEWGKNAQIEKCGMNGDPDTRQILVDMDIEWPNGLAIDYQTERLWWVDAKLANIENVNLDGSDRRKIVSSKDGTLGHPFSLAVFGESIFWTDWSQKLIYRSTKLNPNDKIIVKRIQGVLSPMDIKVVHPHQQPKGLNPCRLDNGQCSHLCLLSPNKTQPFSCFCPTGMRLRKDKKICTLIEDDHPYILFANRVGIFYSDVNLQQVSPVLAGIKGGAAAIDVDVKNKYMYWSNVVNDTIERVSLMHIGAVETIIDTDLKLVDGIAFDWINRKLYWTDGRRFVIEVTDPEETNLRLTLVKDGLDKPRAIVLHPKTRYMYWTDWGAFPKIERCGMNGDLTTRKIIVDRDIGFPNGLAIDYVEEKLWWADALLDKIETANLDGTMRRAVVKEPSIHPFALVVYNNSILWTDWIDNTIFKADKLAGKIFFSKEVGIFRPTGIRVVHAQMYLPEPNPCGRKKKGCSHLCLLAPKPTNYSCRCPNGMSLLPDGKSCR